MQHPITSHNTGLHRGSKVTLIYFPLCLIHTPALGPDKVASGLHGCFDAIHLWDMPDAIPGILRVILSRVWWNVTPRLVWSYRMTLNNSLNDILGTIMHHPTIVQGRYRLGAR